MNAAVIMSRLEVMRVFRNKRYLIFTLALPVGMYLIFGKSQSAMANSSTTVNVFYMVSMATLGAFSGALMGSAIRISTERKAGWTRQLRLTAMPSWAYVVAKVVAALATTIPSVIIVMILGATYGNVHLDAWWKWVALALIIWVGSATFAALSVAMGYRLSPDAVQPASMLVYLPMILLGGIYFAPPSGVMHSIATALPTWQITQASSHLILGTAIPASAFLIIAAWAVGFAALAAVAVRTANNQES